jgi:hypothetical protein
MLIQARLNANPCLFVLKGQSCQGHVTPDGKLLGLALGALVGALVGAVLVSALGFWRRGSGAPK